MSKPTLIGRIFQVSDEIDNGRTASDIVKYSMTELGELAEEVIIDEGRSYKAPGKDGVVGEALDLIACAADMIRTQAPDLTEDQLLEIIEPKLQKWKSKAANYGD
jgi:hypothetical protein